MNLILVVDDSPLDRTLAGRLIENQTGYQVVYAANGVEAIELLEDRLPLAVVTDLQMPEMDGMRLVEEIHRRFATVPVILMTQHGSEDIALDALAHGAADFVPKSQLSTALRDAIASVVALSRHELAQHRLLPHLEYQEQRYTLDNDLDLVLPLVNQLRQFATDMGIVDSANAMRLSKALAEALRNAIWHGNLELSGESAVGKELSTRIAARRASPPYSQRRVFVTAVFTRDEARVTIHDQGPGFAFERLPDVRLDPSQVMAGLGRGLILIRAFLDEVQFGDSGRSITLVKRRR